jgi:hypothetical protein
MNIVAHEALSKLILINGGSLHQWRGFGPLLSSGHDETLNFGGFSQAISRIL